MISLNHIQHQLNLCIRLLRFDAKVADEFANDMPSARRSFNVLWFVVPYSMLMAYLAEDNFIAAKQVDLPLFFGVRIASYFLAVSAGLFGVYLLCRLQGANAILPALADQLQLAGRAYVLFAHASFYLHRV